MDRLTNTFLLRILIYKLLNCLSPLPAAFTSVECDVMCFRRRMGAKYQTNYIISIRIDFEDRKFCMNAFEMNCRLSVLLRRSDVQDWSLVFDISTKTNQKKKEVNKNKYKRKRLVVQLLFIIYYSTVSIFVALRLIRCVGRADVIAHTPS